MYRILMPVDTDKDRALGQAEYVASLPNADESVEAIILFVFHDEGEDVPQGRQQLLTATRVAAVRRAAEYLEERGVETRILEDSGDTTADILQDAEEFDVDAIVLGGRKRTAVGKAIFGSVTQSVLRNTNRPVVVTGRKQE